MHGSSEPVAGVREGDVLAGKYRVERVLGVGGMGVVVAARHLQLDDRVALKFLLPRMLGDANAVSRFLREAKAAVRIKSEYVARVLDVGTLDNGAPYIVMEFLEGGDLAAWLAQRGPLPIEQAVEFSLQACVGVAEAHALGIVHRDLKPSNLFCVRGSDGQFTIKVLDFGISKVLATPGSPGMSLTATASVMGSPLYMSPEQMRSAKDVDVKSDIWALGVILFELLTTRTPFVGESISEVAVNVAVESPPPLRSYRPDAPAGLERVIFRCLAKKRNERFGNVAELARALLEFAPGRASGLVERTSGILARAGEPLGPSPPQFRLETWLAPETVPPFGRTASPRPRLKAAAIVGTGALGAALVGSVLFFAAPRAVSPAASAASAPVGTSSSQPANRGSPALPSAVPAETVSVLAAGSESIETPDAEARILARPSERRPSPRDVARPAARDVGRPTPVAAPPRTPSGPAPPALNCNPPYFVDSDGHRQYKPECL